MTGKPYRAERGIALFISIFALLLLSAVAMGLMFLATTETSINYNYRASQQAVAAANAGLQEVRERMMLANVAPHLITPPAVIPSAVTPNSVMYVLNVPPGTVVDPTNAGNDSFDTQLCQENFPGLGLVNPGAGVRCATAPAGAGWADLTPRSDAPMANTANALSWRWVRVTWKLNSSSAPGTFPPAGFYVNASNAAGTLSTPVCWDGVHQILLPAGLVRCEQPDPGTGTLPARTTVYRLTSLAVTQTGARRMVQMEVAQDPPLITRAAVESKDTVVVGGTVDVYGYDHCSCDCKTVKVGGVDTYTCDSRPGKICDRSKYAIYSSGEIRLNGGPTVEAGTDPKYLPNADWKSDIQAQIDRYRNSGSAVDPTQGCYAGGPSPCGWTCAGGDCGTHTNQRLGVPPKLPPDPPDTPADDPALGAQFDQITFVPGNLHLTGPVGNGVLVVDGDLEINGDLQFYGLILVRGVVSFGGGAANRNIYGSVLSGEEARTDTDFSGNVNITFDVCALPDQDRSKPPVMISTRELNY